MDGWDAVEAVKEERSGVFALDDMSPGPLRKRSRWDDVEVIHYDDCSTNLDTLRLERCPIWDRNDDDENHLIFRNRHTTSGASVRGMCG
eukprot:COSAG05_NODE_13194_length_438_cov_1.828909_1_plen_88_part_10